MQKLKRLVSGLLVVLLLLTVTPLPARSEDEVFGASPADSMQADNDTLTEESSVPSDGVASEGAPEPEAPEEVPEDNTDPASPVESGEAPEEPAAPGEPAEAEAPGETPEEPVAPEEPDGTVYTFEHETLTAEALVSSDSLFTVDDTPLDAGDVYMTGDTEDADRFSALLDGYDGELRTVDLSFCDENGDPVEQASGSTQLTLTVPMDGEGAVLRDVELYRWVEAENGGEGTVERIEDVSVDKTACTVTFDVDGLGAYALRFTVDYYYDGQEYHMCGGTTMLLSELFQQLSIELDAADVVDIAFTTEGLLSFTRYEDGVDWVIQSLAPFDTDETMTLTFADGRKLEILVRDDQGAQSSSTNLDDFMTGWKLTIGDTVFSSESVTDDTVIEYKAGMLYSMELNFAERPELGFDTPATNPPEMYYQLPDNFVVPDDFVMALNVSLGRKGVLADNMLSVEKRIGTDGQEHQFLVLRWNWEDTTHWGFFCDSSQAKLKLVINGVFQDTEPQVLSINGKDVAIRKENLHNAVVNKMGVYNPQTGIIAYTVTVSSNGTTSDITLTDTPGRALVYQGDVAYDSAASTNRSGTVPQITARTGNTFSVVIPEMNDGDLLVFRYSAQVNYDAIAVSGNPSFEETGNTAQIFGDSYTLDNIALYHETDIEFSDLEKNVVSKRQETIDGKYSYILSWEIETNKRAQFPLADTTITDTIAPAIESFSRYYGDGLTVKCYAASGALEDTRQISWADLGVDLADDTTWTYHIPDTDPQYRYVLTYDTIVDMSAQTNTVVAENTAEGKGGIDSDRAVLTLPGVAGFSVSKKATNVDSTHVTWEITMTVSGASLNSQRIVLAERSGTKTTGNQTSWYSDNLPGKWFDLTYDGVRYYGWYKETLQKVEVIGLEGDETFEVTYGYLSSGVLNTRPYHPDSPGQSVLEENFAAATSKWQPDYFRLEFYKDFERSQGGLTNPGGENPSRTLTIRLTTSFPEEWAIAARASVLNSNKMESSIFAHVNWIEVLTPENGALKSRAIDTDKIEPMPPSLYKSVIDFTDTSLATASQKQKWPLNFPDVIYSRNYTSLSYSDAEHKDLPVFPAFRYQVLITGIKYDEPLVIEDNFDTSKFALLTVDNLHGSGGIITCKSKYYTQNLVMRVAGTRFFGSFPAGNNNYYRYDPNSITYSFGIRNTGYTDLAEDHGCELELTDTGFRVTINELFRDPDGNLYPNYGVEYYLVPKNLEALREIEEIARANGVAGLEPKAPFTNTASCRGLTASATVKYSIINDFMPIDKTSEAYIDLFTNERLPMTQTDNNGQIINTKPDGVNDSDVMRYVMKYRVVLNKGGERLNGGNPITAEDEYSSNLSVDFTSIQITTDPAGANVSYDFSGNIGYFTIPDETQVIIEYEAQVLHSGDGIDPVSNEVRMLQYRKSVQESVDHGGAGGSSATNPSILIKKYGSGHMEKGLNYAEFQLFQYKYPTYTRGDPNTKDDWVEVIVPKPSEHFAVYTTQNLTVGDKHYGDGYAEIELSSLVDGITLIPGVIYGLRETKTPVGTAPNGDTITYQNPHNDNFYCYVFSISEDQDADYNNYVFLDGDTMTVRNNPESTTLHLSKQLLGNCTLSDTEKAALSYQIFRKHKLSEDAEAIYMPIMTTVDDPNNPGQAIEVIDDRFVGISYDDISGGAELTGLTLASGTTVGEYLIVEYGNDTILADHPDWSWIGTYTLTDAIGNTNGSFTNSSFTVYDETGANPQIVKGIEFTVTSQEIRDGDSKSVEIHNSYQRATVELTAVKRWTGPSGATIAWPSGKSVVFTLGTLDENDVFTAVSDVSPITLDNQKDQLGESLPGRASFKDLPKFEAVNGQVQAIRYAVRETSSAAGYDIVYPVAGLDYAAFGTETSVTIKNQVVSTAIHVSKAWDKGQIPAGATATFRLYSYTGDDPTAAVWVSNVNDITLDGVLDGGEETFGERTAAWTADFTGLPLYDGEGRELHYLVKEQSCTPAGYEAVQDSAGDGETITNKPASATFTVSKRWSGTPNDAWPSGEQITLVLRRKTAAGVVDDSFSAAYVLSAGAIVSQDKITDPYGDERETGVLSGGALTVTDLQKFDGSGNEWRYFVTETAITSSGGDDLSGNYTTVYRDKNNYTVSGAYTYSGGSVTNTRSTKELTLSKTVSGNMGDRTKGFAFTVVLTDGSGTPYDGPVAYTLTDQDGAVTSGTAVFVIGEASFQLRHNESVTLHDLSGSLSFTITESEDDAGGYQTACSVNGTGSTLGRTATGTLASNPVVAFTNNRQVMIPTGVSDGALFAAPVLGLALLALGLLVRFRRRREEEADEA